MLVRLARQAEVGPGQSIEKEIYGRKLLIVRHPENASVSVLDAHCFHMGTPLVGGDIEDLNGRACVVCPAHRYRIDLATGQKLDADLCGKLCASADQKQRVYSTACDDEFIWADVPESAASLPPLPSDYYNQVQQHRPGMASDPSKGRVNYGLFGQAAPRDSSSTQVPSSSFSANAAAPLKPFANGANGWPASLASSAAAPSMSAFNASAFAAEEPPLVLSQEAPSEAPACQGAPGEAPFPSAAGRIDFPAVKRVPPHVARRKAATAAILSRSYRPPMATDSAMQSPVKLAEEAAPPQPTAPTTNAVRQRTLLESWGMQPVAAGSDAMDTN